MADAVLAYLEIAVAVLIILATVKSAWNGWLRKKVIVPLDRLEGMSEDIEDVREKTDEMYERQEIQIDAVIALARAMDTENEFDEREFREEVGRATDPQDFLRGGKRGGDD